MTKTTQYNKETIKDIIGKINILVGIYADSHELEEYVEDESIIYNETNIVIRKINFKKQMKSSLDSNIIKFFSTLSELLSDAELEVLFIKKFYNDYLMVYDITNMFIFGIPRNAIEGDLVELNKLYKTYTQHAKPKTDKE